MDQAEQIISLQKQLAEEQDRVALVAQGIEHYSGCPYHFAGNPQDPECCRCRAEKAEALKTELVEVLAGVLAQACHTDGDDPALDSCALSAYRDGLKLLAELGKVTIVREHGRRVLANWVKDGANE